MTSVNVSFVSHSSVHLKIHIPKIIKKHTHVQTIYKHHYQKVPVLDEGEDDEYKDGSEKYIRIDPKITLSALKATHNFGGGGVSGNELRSLKWAPQFNYQQARELQGAYSSALKGHKRYPKNVKVVQEYEDYPHQTKSHRIIKQLIPTYEIQEDSDEDYNHSNEDYAESKPKTRYLKKSSKTLKFIPASEVSQYIPTIPFSALTAQSQFKPIWTPTEFISRPGKNKEHQRPGRSSRYEGTTMRVFSTEGGGGGDSYGSPMLPGGGHLELRLRRNY